MGEEHGGEQRSLGLGVDIDDKHLDVERDGGEPACGLSQYVHIQATGGTHEYHIASCRNPRNASLQSVVPFGLVAIFMEPRLSVLRSRGMPHLTAGERFSDIQEGHEAGPTHLPVCRFPQQLPPSVLSSGVFESPMGFRAVAPSSRLFEMSTSRRFLKINASQKHEIAERRESHLSTRISSRPMMPKFVGMQTSRWWLGGKEGVDGYMTDEVKLGWISSSH